MDQHKFDLAISFAGEQRGIAEAIAVRLDASGYSVFYDRFEAAELWGQDLSVSLAQVYSRDARYCFVLVSQEYVQKAWTNFERQNAIGRFMQENEGYVLCARFDDAVLPGLPSVVGYVDFREYGEEGIYHLLLQRLGPPYHAGQLSRLSEEDRDLARQVIEACYRRSIFTNMQGEISLDAMYASIGKALGVVQRLIPRIRDQALQRVCLDIVGALDTIERSRIGTGVRFFGNDQSDIPRRIDEQKLTIVRSLLEIRRAARIPMQLPFGLIHGHFFSLSDADSPPKAY